MTKTPHKHAEAIRAWANGDEIEFRAPDTTAWVWSPAPAWVEDYEYRVKPVRVYPEIALQDEQLVTMLVSAPTAAQTTARMTRYVANAAIRHAIDNGQVVTREEFARCIADMERLHKAIGKMAREMAECSPGPGGYRLMESEVKALEKCILTRHLGADYSIIIDKLKS